MNNYNWKNEMPEVPESIHNMILETLEEIETNPLYRKRTGRIKKGMMLPLVAALCLTLGGSVFAAVNLYQQRMEAMSREMLEEFYSTAFTGSVFHYSRELSEKESKAYEALVKQYENEGKFPEGNVFYLEDYKDYKGKGIGLYVARSTVFLPDYEMSEEELLQLIDFEHKISYSVNTIGAEIVEGEYDYEYDYEQVAPVENGDSVIEYEGDVGVICATEGKEVLYLAGKNIIERMTFGDSMSTPFYKGDFGENSVVYEMEEDEEQGLYVLVLSKDESGYDSSRILHISKAGSLIYEKEIQGYVAYDIAVDKMGRLYLQGLDKVYVWDENGNEIREMEIPYKISYSIANGSLCQGKDGKVYSLCETASFHAAILCLDPDAEEQIVMVASEGLPTGAPHCDTLAKGKNSDFVIWRDDGVYTYNLGDTYVHKVLEVYEAPLQWESAEFMTLEDGRIVFVKYFDAVIGEEPNPEVLPVPESVRICYVTCKEAAEENKVVFERSDEMIFGEYIDNLKLYADMYYKSYEKELAEIDNVVMTNVQGQKKQILSNGIVVENADMYLIKKQGVSGITLISEILSAAKWQDGTTDCNCDCQITFGDKEYGYHSECGTIVDMDGKRYCKIADEEYEMVNKVLYYYFAEDN